MFRYYAFLASCQAPMMWDNTSPSSPVRRKRLVLLVTLTRRRVRP